MKFRPVGAELFHADGQTDMTKLIVTFLNFAKTPTSSSAWRYTCSSSTSSITDPIWTVMELNQNLCCRKPTTIRLKNARTSRKGAVELGYNVMWRYNRGV